MTRTGLLYTAVWLACMTPFSILLGLLGDRDALTFWRWWGVL